ncbi:MAG: hypothetical protein E6G92_00045 [Alphaproteobacteria bacterium]|nr:MAG: hypothetical protein E6G92_00045 [Alphaproteobacteria bacterium]
MGKGKKRGIWTPQIRERFLAALRETGNARAAYRRIGHQNMFMRRRRSDPEFARDWAEAEKAADGKWSAATSAFAAARKRPCKLPKSAPDPDRLLRPMPKRKPEQREQVIRRTRGGRVQIALAPERNMTSEQEGEFLTLLRATGNFSQSALAIGFQPASLFQRMRRWPAFAQDCDSALKEASIQLDYRLAAHAHMLLKAPGAADEPEDDGTPFDPDKAMRILSFLDRRRGGGTTRGRRRKGPPERSFEEAVESVLAKIEAIERHEAMLAAGERGDEESG